MLNVTFGAATPRRLPARSTILCARGYVPNGRGGCQRAMPVRRRGFLGQTGIDQLRHLPPHEVGMPTQGQLLTAASMWASLPEYRRAALMTYIAHKMPQLFDEGIVDLPTAGSRVSSGLVPNPM